MKTLKLLFLFSLSTFSFQLSFGQNWLWGRKGNMLALKPMVSATVATDANGNAFLTGGYYPELSFGRDTLADSSLNNRTDAYYMKYNSAGNVQWAKQFASIESSSTSIATDASNNVIIAGVFRGNMMIGSDYLQGNFDFFLTKCDNNGNPLWAVAADTGSTVYAYTNPNALAIDKSNNIIISGYFSDKLKLGAYTLVAPDTAYNVFTAKYDSNGNVIWAKQSTDIAPVSTYNDQSYSVATDLNGNSFVTGTYNYTIVFGNDTLTHPKDTVAMYNNQMKQVFLVKYDPNGNVLWARQSVVPSARNSAMGYSVTTDSAGNAYITGTFTDSVSFGNYKLTGAGLFFVKYSSNGDVVWVKSTLGYTGYSLVSDKYSNLYLSGGGSRNNIYFGSYTLNTPPGASDASTFIIKFDTGGNVICGSLLENGGSVYTSLAVEKSGVYAYLASIVFSDTVFCAGDTLTSYGQGPYIARWQNCGAQDGIPGISSSKPSVLLYPNPSNGIFQLEIKNEELGINTVEVYNMLGEKVYTETLRYAQGDNLIDLSNQPNGVYLYRVITENGQLVGEGKVIIQK